METNNQFFTDENILPDEYPVHWDYIYIADGKLIRSDIKGTVRDLKRDLKATEIRRCNIIARQEAAMKEKSK